MYDIKELKPKNKSQTKFSQGYFIPKNPQKYIGDLTKIIFRSSWEYNFLYYCDRNDLILKWSSEPFHIKYISPLDGKEHKYFVDFYIEYISNENDKLVKKALVEIKPKNKLKKPEPPKTKNKKSLKNFEIQYKEWLVLESKIQYAKKFCQINNLEYIIVTEEFLFNQIK
jgi:hypothetical protein